MVHFTAVRHGDLISAQTTISSCKKTIPSPVELQKTTPPQHDARHRVMCQGRISNQLQHVSKAQVAREAIWCWLEMGIFQRRPFPVLVTVFQC